MIRVYRDVESSGHVLVAYLRDIILISVLLEDGDRLIVVHSLEDHIVQHCAYLRHVQRDVSVVVHSDHSYG